MVHFFFLSLEWEPKKDYQFQLVIFTSLVICDLLNEIQLKDVKIKWPNDIYIGNKKIAGILFQNFVVGESLTYSVIGIGININQKKILT